jgi:hypothetical protein
MNTASLARHYDALTPWERLPLVVAAGLRNDTLEQRRLTASAPQLYFHIPHHWCLMDGFYNLVHSYVMQQLASATTFWRLQAFLADSSLFEDAVTEQQNERLWKVLKFEAHRFVVRADGWKLLCQELHIDADLILRDLPGYDHICQVEKQGRRLACTPEEGLTYLKELWERRRFAQDQGPGVPYQYRLDSAADIAQAMREELEEHMAARH